MIKAILDTMVNISLFVLILEIIFTIKTIIKYG